MQDLFLIFIHIVLQFQRVFSCFYAVFRILNAQSFILWVSSASFSSEGLTFCMIMQDFAFDSFLRACENALSTRIVKASLRRHAKKAAPSRYTEKNGSFSALRLHQMAGHEMPRRGLLEGRRALAALVAGQRAAAGERAALGLVDRAGHVALDDLALLLRLQLRVGNRHGGKQRLRIRVQRVGVELVARRQLHHAAQIHHRDAVGDVFDDVQIVRDEQVRQPHALLQIVQEVNHLRLNRHIQRGDRLDPVKVVLTNYEAGKTEDCVIENHPKKPEMGTHTVPLTREIYIEREDFMVDAPKKFFRLKPDGEVRLKGAYIVKCERYDVDEAGNVTCIYCSVDFTSKSGSEGADRKVKGTIHWVSAERNIPFEGRLYDVLMRDDDEQAEIAPEEETDEESAAPAKDFTARLNPDSLKTIRGFAEPWLAEAKAGDDFQFLRMGYFCKDKDSTADMAVFNRVVPLKDSYKPE